MLGTRMICKTNAEWAQLKKDGVALNPAEPHAAADNDPRDVAAHGCHHGQAAAPGDGTGANKPRHDCPKPPSIGSTGYGTGRT